MHLSLLASLRCPAGCESSLKLKDEVSNGDIVTSGLLTCPVCNRVYEIAHGIPKMLPDHLRTPASAAGSLPTDSLQQQKEIRARDAQVNDYDGMWYLNLYGLLEIPMTIRYLDLCSRHVLLEAGCGTGRMTIEFAKRSQQVIAMDFSWESLLVCARKLKEAGVENVDLIQADLCNMPLRQEVCDRVVSCGVLEHIPTDDLRRQAIREMGRVCSAGRPMVISAYKHSLYTRLMSQKEGEHEGGIYYFRFSKPELHALLSQEVQVDHITGALVYYFIARCTSPAK
ncbi:MAG: methyltransferase domain-containing protein [Armatimonadota bacterium]